MAFGNETEISIHKMSMTNIIKEVEVEEEEHEEYDYEKEFPVNTVAELPETAPTVKRVKSYSAPRFFSIPSNDQSHAKKSAAHFTSDEGQSTNYLAYARARETNYRPERGDDWDLDQILSQHTPNQTKGKRHDGNGAVNNKVPKSTSPRQRALTNQPAAVKSPKSFFGKVFLPKAS
eukprot:CAMPEP_0184700478 /NCGR_PEP_ID=MMETSP0313-20130426/13678_1 /TAXON_ID=2792 /ORGANISM="Porphyridium aerugineum, Strain SAG 1380-2" /LENGTH=175 /DNA_ID=CAMNT_0027160177 /DNA_START=36 /DNA_END=563 /DNA_ORIENTATION=+